MKYFIEAAYKILEEEGIDNLTARKVADLAGYNSATLYNYFENLDHLICYASMGYLKAYYAELSTYISKDDQPRNVFLKTWELFAYHSFKRPIIFKIIFFSQFNHQLKNMINTYFELFPEDFGEHQKDLIPMLREGDLKQRNMTILSQKLGDQIPKDQLILLNELIILVFRGSLESVIAGEFTSVKEAVENTLRLISFALDFFYHGA
ncbi:MAG: TetR/AcrR family transcriptional regulator [Dehalobacterium sp.]